MRKKTAGRHGREQQQAHSSRHKGCRPQATSLAPCLPAKAVVGGLSTYNNADADSAPTPAACHHPNTTPPTHPGGYTWPFRCR